ncbi:hypothetical protein M422DRAFT_266323 [Sphaerobolus stellatus SS14]|uniref:Uncharacterized protein n=1 Tax=Sphaerobolus stellatus (strain SS14) TaxID=990650 RepID=A0A0C9URZ1_SPHS4|nr:hypothetical protein M422DRAFT_266323 [Sphaerobolus stellatus SS14]
MVLELAIEYLESQFIMNDLPTHDWNPVAILSASTSEFQVVVMDVACQVFSISLYDIGDDLVDIINKLRHPRLVPPSWSFGLLSICRAVQFLNYLCAIADDSTWDPLRMQLAVDLLGGLLPPLRAIARIATDVLSVIGNSMVKQIAIDWPRVSIDNHICHMCHTVQDLEHVLGQNWVALTSMDNVATTALHWFDLGIQLLLEELPLSFLACHSTTDLFKKGIKETRLLEVLREYRDELIRHQTPTLKVAIKRIEDEIERWQQFSRETQSQHTQVNADV